MKRNGHPGQTEKGLLGMIKDQAAPNAGIGTHRIKWCDLHCKHARFAKTEALDGSCRTFQSLWCAKLKSHVTKNSPCQAQFGKRRPTTGF